MVQCELGSFLMQWKQQTNPKYEVCLHYRENILCSNCSEHEIWTLPISSNHAFVLLMMRAFCEQCYMVYHSTLLCIYFSSLFLYSGDALVVKGIFCTCVTARSYARAAPITKLTFWFSWSDQKPATMCGWAFVHLERPWLILLSSATKKWVPWKLVKPLLMHTYAENFTCLSLCATSWRVNVDHVGETH